MFHIRTHCMGQDDGDIPKEVKRAIKVIVALGLAHIKRTGQTGGKAGLRRKFLADLIYARTSISHIKKLAVT